VILASLAFAPALPGARGQEPVARSTLPLHERIDAMVEAAAVGPLAPLCSDADFVRRVYLDLTGIIPTADEARMFVAAESPVKRQRLIERLLASDAFNRHMTIALDVMLMERRPDKAVKQPEWEAYLYQSVATDKPLDGLFRELLAADGADQAQRPAARFVLDRDAEPNLVTRDVGRIAFGMDLQCCQCHDHPLIDDYLQDDYYGLFAFIHRTSLFTDAKTKLISLSEKAEGEASFKSVFTGAGNDRARPRLPKGTMLFAEPVFAKGTEYAVKPEKTVRGVPKFSRRSALAKRLGDSREFTRNLANRLWALLLGRGIVHPLDFHYAANPPTNPRLLSLLADELAAGGFQLRPLLREMALTRVYQRSCDAPQPETVNIADVAARLERLAQSRKSQGEAISPLEDSLAAAKAAFQAVQEEDARLAAQIEKLQKAVADARQASEKATAAQQAAAAATDKLQSQLLAVNQAAEKLAAAVAAVPGDKGLATAEKEIHRAAGELKKTAADAAAKRAARTSEKDAAARTLTEAEAAVATAIAARPASDRLRELEGAALDAEHALREARYEAKSLDAQIALARAIVEHAKLAKADAEKAAAAWGSLVEHWTIRGQLGPLKPLTPEQIAASAMQAAGMLAPQLAAAEAKLQKSPTEALKKATAADRERVRAAAVQLELLNQLRGPAGEFVRQYGGEPGAEFQATVNQALFFGNGTTIDAWLKPAGESLVSRLTKIDDPVSIADEMAWAVFSRGATDRERQAAAAYLKDRADKPAALAEMVWGLLSSTEFRFGH
jgi:hypothetical protein